MKITVSKNIFIVVIISMMVMARTALGQSLVIDLWGGRVPGSIERADYKPFVDDSSNWVKMQHISNPVLDMYTPPVGKSNGTAVIICPGGGYWALAISHEGAEVAKWFNSFGVTAFVLKYRLPDDLIMHDKAIGPLQDAQRAMRIVRRHAGEWGIDPKKIGIMGFSAGGHLASTLSTHFQEKVYESTDSTSARPDFSLLIYPVISMEQGITHSGSRENLLGKNPTAEQLTHFSNDLQVTQQTPPAFLVHSMDDYAVQVQNSIRYALALKKFNIPSELHLYEHGGHGYGLGRSEDTESSWPDACKKWLKARGYL